MKAIRTKANAREIAKKVISDKLTIQLCDEMDTSRVVQIVDAKDGKVKFNAFDSVTGYQSYGWMAEAVFIEEIWINRKFINQSGQLASL